MCASQENAGEHLFRVAIAIAGSLSNAIDRSGSGNCNTGGKVVSRQLSADDANELERHRGPDGVLENFTRDE
jgi:hypothetical protein